MLKCKTHFEQVPLELVRKIARPDVPDYNVDRNDSAVPVTPASERKLHRSPSPRKNRRSV
jgi:hypothetical protein